MENKIQDIENYRNLTYEQKIAELEQRIKVIERLLPLSGFFIPENDTFIVGTGGKLIPKKPYEVKIVPLSDSPTTVPVVELPHI